MSQAKDHDSDLLVSTESDKIAGLCVAIQSLCGAIDGRHADDIVVLQLTDAICSVAQAIRDSADCISAEIT